MTKRKVIKLTKQQDANLRKGLRQAYAKHFVIKKACGCKRRWWGTPLVWCGPHGFPDEPRFH